MTGRREDVLATLRAAPGPMTIAEIAEQLAIHPNPARFHLDALTRSGRIETVEPERPKPGRPPLMFRAATGMDPAGPRDYQMLAGVLADAIADRPDPAAEAAAAGRAWADRHTTAGTAANRGQTVDRLTDVLAEIGFAPEKRSAPGDAVQEIGLRNCPFLELTADRGDVICQVHLGLMQGAVAAWKSPVKVESLTPFAEPNLCLARLGPVAGQS